MQGVDCPSHGWDVLGCEFHLVCVIVTVSNVAPLQMLFALHMQLACTIHEPIEMPTYGSARREQELGGLVSRLIGEAVL